MNDDFFIVDVFAERPYSGNPLAVILNNAEIDTPTMQRIAAEMNFSETVFVAPAPDTSGVYAVRIFTPVRELDFAGHPILGTAWVLREHVARDRSDEVTLGLKVGAVPVRFAQEDSAEVAWFQAPPMSLGIQAAREDMALALNIAPDDIDTKAPCRVVAAGTSAVIVPLRSQRALSSATLDLEKYQPLLSTGFPPLVYLFTREAVDTRNDLCVRFFFEANGVREDPATGNGAAFLGAYLLEHNFLRSQELSLRIEQGHALGRPSLILLRARNADSVQEVYVGGQIQAVVSGRLQ